MGIIIETQRLILRDWQEDDFEHLVSMNQDPLVMKYFPDTLSREETLSLFLRLKSHFDQWKYGLCATFLKADNSFIGFIGLSHPRFESSFTPCVEIGWRLISKVWGNGLATEGADAMLNYAFKELEIDEIYSFTACENTASFRVMEKIGMKRIGVFAHPNIPQEHALSRHWIYHLTNPMST